MAEGSGGMLLVLLLSVACAVATVPTNTPHQGEAGNHVEDVYIEDALSNWLDNFDTYTFMVKQDLDDTHHHHDPEKKDEEGEGDDGHEEEEDEESVGESWNAPIAVTLDKEGLLNPHVDYHVMVESLVAEAGSIFLTLRKYENKSQCGVGGLTRKDSTSVPHTHNGQRLAIGEEYNETIINFDIQDEVNSSHPESLSEWDGLSEEFWWASGRLAGGGVLSLSFTPPECGCLTLSTYYALPVGNLTLVVGPQAYPSELQMLLCVDHLAAYEDSADYYDEEDKAGVENNDYTEGEHEEDHAVGDQQESSTEMNTSQGGRTHIVNGRSTKLETWKARKEAKRLAKAKRQKRRQKIRQAGRRQARKQARNVRRNGRQRNRRQRNNVQQHKKAWKKLKRQNRRRQRINRRRNHHGVVEGEAERGNITEGESRENTQNTTHFHAEKLINLLLGEPIPENETHDENPTSATTVEVSEGETAEESEGTAVSEPSTRREIRRRNRQQRRKLRRRERNRATHPPGVKFCCKQGIKQKKFVFAINNTSEDLVDPEMCSSSSNSIVTTFANSQFNITQERCAEVFNTCCNNFTSEIWETIKARKAAHRQKRKQRRRSRRQQRKEVRKERKRSRRVQRRQGRNHGTTEEEEVHAEE